MRHYKATFRGRAIGSVGMDGTKTRVVYFECPANADVRSAAWSASLPLYEEIEHLTLVSVTPIEVTP